MNYWKQMNNIQLYNFIILLKCGQDQQTDFDMYNVDLYFSTIPCHSLLLYAIGTPFMILKYFPLFAAATSHNKVSSEHI